VSRPPQTTSLVREAMVVDPVMLDGSATAREAGELLAEPNARAIFVCEGGNLTGVVTRKTLVREVVAPGLDPTSTPLAQIAEPPIFTLEAGTPLDEAFRELEARDLERVPVVESGRLVGVLSRAVVQRRLAEDEPPPDEDVAA
jgi:CBS domain-containing protein